MNVSGVRRKIQRWDDVNGMVMEDGGLLETPEGQAEGPALTNPLSDNPLKNAEMAVEDDYGMIDGILNNGSKEPTVAQLEQQARSGQPISLMDLAAAAHREDRDKKKSVVEQLKSQPKTEHKKTAPKKSAEREI